MTQVRERAGFWPWRRKATASQADPTRYTAVWPAPDSRVRDEATAFWARLNVLPPGVDPAARAAQLVVVAHVGSRLAVVSSAEIVMLPTVQRRFAMYRALVDPDFRTLPRILGLTRSAHACLEDWSRRNPEEEVMGMAAVIENAGLQAIARRPAWPMREGDSPTSGLVLAGYTDRDEQIRLSWFDHARV